MTDYVLRVRMPRRLMHDTTTDQEACGLSPADAVRCPLTRVVRDKALPFDITPPTDEEVARTRLELEIQDRQYDSRRLNPPRPSALP